MRHTTLILRLSVSSWMFALLVSSTALCGAEAVDIVDRTSSALRGAFYFREDSGEGWERVSKVGPHPDVLVRLGNGKDRLVFWRGSSYLPFWETARGRWFFDALVTRSGDGESLRHDAICQYASVKVVERTPARAVVLWRYIPDFAHPGLDGWVEETFVVYPNGACFRTVRDARDTSLAEWLDPSRIEIAPLLLLETGVVSLPSSWRRPARMRLSRDSATHYESRDYDEREGCYILRLKKGRAPQPLRFTLDTTDGRSVHDPALVIRGWGNAGVTVEAGGKPFAAFAAGHVRQLDGADLVLWLGVESTTPLEVVITPVGGGPPVVRTPVPSPPRGLPAPFPRGSTDPGPFGAYYTHLRYTDVWDAQWRVGDDPDVVVQFDDVAHRLLFWRGAGYVPHWANAENRWYNNEFCERRAGDAGRAGCCCEPMQDHECRYSTARIIASHDARVVVHWRYGLCDRNYDHCFVDETGWGDWVDEYHVVYPDAVSVRKAILYTSAPDAFAEWHEAIPLVSAGTLPEDNIEMEAVALTDENGNKHVYSWENGFPTEFHDNLNIMLVGLKGSTKPFVIVESRGVWVDEVSTPDERRFNQYDDWPGWPSSLRRGHWTEDPVDGYRSFWKILPSHSSLMHFAWDDYASGETPVPWRTKIMLHGMTASNDVNALIPLAKSWEAPPRLELANSGFTGGRYDKTERAYRIQRSKGGPTELAFTLRGTSDHPIVNPCVIVEGWPEDVRVRLEIDGRAAAPRRDFRQGLERTADGRTSLVVWIRKRATAPIRATIKADRHR